MPEGDTLHRAAAKVRRLVGQRLDVVAPHPRGAAVADRIDGRVLEDVAAVGKNILLTFEGGLVVRSHLRMRGRWRVEPAGTQSVGTPWLFLRGQERHAMLERLRKTDQSREIGEALLDQTLVSGIGNMWKAEGLFAAGISPWLRLN